MEKINRIADRYTHELREKLGRSEQPKLTQAEYDALRLAKIANARPCSPSCPHCGGSGYTRSDVPRDHPDFGRVVVCPSLAARVRQEELHSGDPRFGLTPDEIQNLAWNDVKPHISDGLKAVAAVRPALDLGWGMVFLGGAPGQAKTLVCKISVALALKAGKRAAYADLRTMLDDIKLAFDNDDHMQAELLRRSEWWQDLDVLAIDELDKANPTPWARERIHSLLDRRYVMAVREQAVTIVAANAGVGELDGYLASRLQDNRFGPGNVVVLNGPDGRQSMPKGYRY
jgi:DNA replication protein DnaC